MPKHRILLGFDFGLRRLGIAVGQTLTQSANPLAVLKAVNGKPHWQTIQALIETWQADGLVVGIPLNMDGSEQPLTHLARRFSHQLAGRFKLPVYTTDERLTSIQATRELWAQKMKPNEIDSYAAKLILETWLHEYETSDNS